MKRSSGYNDFEWAVGINRFMLRVVGLWPPDNHGARATVDSKFRILCSFITLFIVLTIPALISLIKVWGDMTLMIENMQYTLPILGAVFKICIISQKQADLLPLVEMIERDWVKPKSEEERGVMLRRARTVRAIAMCVLHVCGQLENLYLRLTRMEKYTDFSTALKHNVQDHVRLIRSIKIIDHTFDSMLLVLLLHFAILFCFQGFLIVDVVNRKGQLSMIQLIWFVAAIVYALIHMCLYCVVGEILVIQYEKIHQATYEYPWYNKESKVAKNLILIMLCASKPLLITAGKIFPMTMATFCNLLKTSAGYISILLANQN
ncbi:odorant receptor Or2-like isoform X2 [Harpegnathos saltator]|uniref:odorant receptor Or2-like isoform X2 n=1 Tax=Harpegnathos saltator TaxID=610380 RepID=UPI000948EB0D|nr:odorant receptor Or2-like isoform X2 [Harpegnathos saltator]